jgi:hypothetical protein
VRTDANLAEICAELERNLGDLHAAARSIGVSPAFVMRWMREDDKAAEQIQEAQRVGWLGIESEALRRAVRGHEEPVFYKGMVVGSRPVYSDGLLSKILEARVPEYKKGEGAGGVSLNLAVQVNNMPRAENYEHWLEMKAATLKQRDEDDAARKALPPPDASEQIVDAEFTPVEKPLAALAGLGL